MARRKHAWWESVKALDDWAHALDWPTHLEKLNELRGLGDDRRLKLSIEGWPPAWFTGNIEALRPRNWVLAVSLNPASPSPDHYGDYESSNSWDFWRNHNRDSNHWNNRTKFFPRLAELARTALPAPASDFDNETIASDYMLFLEFCPYASQSYPFDKWDKLGGAQGVADSDVGFAINRQIRQIAFLHGQPLLALVQGGHSRNDVKDFQSPYMTEKVIGEGDEQLNVWTGEFHGANGSVPILSFPFFTAPTSLKLEIRMNLLKSEIQNLLRLNQNGGFGSH